MHTEPPDLDSATLLDVLERHWDIRTGSLSYLPVGFGSHHWRADGSDGAPWFVTAVDLRAGHHADRSADDVFAALDRAFRTAAALGGAGLEFVLSPIPSGGGAVLRRVGERYAIRVEPLVEGTASVSGEFERTEDRRRMGTLLGRLHAASEVVPAAVPGREDFVLPGRAALEQALVRLDAPWDAGPFGEPARALLRANAEDVANRLRAYDGLAAGVRGGSTSWVVTHGEPHGANVIRTRDGTLLLVDWDTALVGPRERDLWMTLDADLTGWDEYRDVVGPAQLNEQALALYPMRWALAEICEYVAAFRQPHEETEDTRAAWEELGEYLPVSPA